MRVTKNLLALIHHISTVNTPNFGLVDNYAVLYDGDLNRVIIYNIDSDELFATECQNDRSKIELVLITDIDRQNELKTRIYKYIDDSI